jgi:hypothetical protein
MVSYNVVLEQVDLKKAWKSFTIFYKPSKIKFHQDVLSVQTDTDTWRAILPDALLSGQAIVMFFMHKLHIFFVSNIKILPAGAMKYSSGLIWRLA